MKWNLILLVVVGLCGGLSACGDNATPPKAAENSGSMPKLNIWEVPPTGTEVASYSKKIEDDPLNNAAFEVKVFTMDSTATQSEFEIAWSYGAAGSSSIKVFPKWYEGNVVKPVIMPVDSLKYAALIGFDPGDGSFKELYLLQYKDDQLRLTRTKAYRTTGPKNAK